MHKLSNLIKSIKRSKKSALLKKITKLSESRFRRPVILVVSFAIVGILLLIITNAQTASPNFEAESGTGTAGRFSGDSTASGGGGIRFGRAYQELFVSTSGSDAKDGKSQANAVKSISKAVELASGPSRIRILSGTYYETVEIQKNDLIIEPFGNGDVTINGAIPEFINGVAWEYVQPGIYRFNLQRDELLADGNTIYTGDGKQQWSYSDVFALLNRQTTNQLPGAVLCNCLFRNDVYVATSNGQAPTAPLYIASRSASIGIYDASNISINGINGSKLKVAYGGSNINVNNSTNITIDNVDIIGGSAGLSAFDSSYLTIKNSRFRGQFDRNWDGADVKDRPGTKSMENQAMIVRATSKDISNIVVDNNELSGYWGGVHFPTLFNRSTTTKFYNDNSVISNNLVHDMAVGIEPEAPFRNLVVKGNTVYDAFEPFSPTPAMTGPTYVYENLFIANRGSVSAYSGATWSPSYAIKMLNTSVGLPENIHFYNNTMYFAGNSGNLRMTVHSTPGLITKNATFTNNIFYSYQGGILRGTGRVEDGSDFDGNVFYSEKVVNDNYFAWNTLYDTADIAHRYSSLNDIISSGAMPSQWKGNVEGNPNFNCVTPTNASCFRASAAITKPSSKQPIPNDYPESSRLNSRTRIGAFEQ